MAHRSVSSFDATVRRLLDRASDDNTAPTRTIRSSSGTLDIESLEPVELIRGVRAASSPKNICYNLSIDSEQGRITNIQPVSPETDNENAPLRSRDMQQCFALPSLCHPHVHLDKPYLLSHPSTSHLVPKSGDFKEALSMTGQAKKLYTPKSLLERGNWLIADSVRAGVTHMRAFVEIDATVKFMCLNAGLELKELWADRCEIQICAFAQDPIFSGENAEENRSLLEEAAGVPHVDAVGSTPYVEENQEKGRQNVDFAMALAVKYGKHLDFHLDYYLDEKREPMVWHVLDQLVEKRWVTLNPRKTVALGHCTRLTLFGNKELEKMASIIKQNELPIFFVGLPTSDLFMMARTSDSEETRDRKRGTLQIPWLVEKFGLSGAIGINNVGNAFTPQGGADPMGLASMCVGLYQVGTVDKAELLYVSYARSRVVCLADTIVEMRLDARSTSHRI